MLGQLAFSTLNLPEALTDHLLQAISRASVGDKKRRDEAFLVLLALCLLQTVTAPGKAETSGLAGLLVLPVRFAEIGNRTTLNQIRGMLMESSEYFEEVSFGQERLDFELLESWLDMPRSMSYYGNYSDNNHTLGALALIADALNAAATKVEVGAYKAKLIVHSGPDEAYTRNETDIWSIASFELVVVSEEDPLGVFCHELMHSLGVLYDFQTGPWCIMGHGLYNDNGRHPSHPVTWCKMRLGWIQSSQVLVSRDTTAMVSLHPAETPTTGIIALRIPLSDSSYYIAEFRRCTLYDSYLPAEGLLVTLIDESLWLTVAGGETVRMIDAGNSTESLDDAAFGPQLGRDAVFLDASHDISLVVLRETESALEVHLTTYSVGRAAQAAHTALSHVGMRLKTLTPLSFGGRHFNREAAAEANRGWDAYTSGNYTRASGLARTASTLVCVAAVADMAFIGMIALMMIAALAIVRQRRAKDRMEALRHGGAA